MPQYQPYQKPPLFDFDELEQPCLLCGHVKRDFYLRIKTPTGGFICEDCFAKTDFKRSKNKNQIRMF